MSYCTPIEVLFDDNERIWKILLGTWDREESWKALVMLLWNVNSQIASLSLLLLAVFAWEQILAGAHWLQESGTLYFLQIVHHAILPKWSATSKTQYTQYVPKYDQREHIRRWNICLSVVKSRGGQISCGINSPKHPKEVSTEKYLPSKNIFGEVRYLPEGNKGWGCWQQDPWWHL